MQRKTLNIPAEDYKILSDYCKRKSLNLVKWMMSVCKNEIKDGEGDSINNHKESDVDTYVESFLSFIQSIRQYDKKQTKCVKWNSSYQLRSPYGLHHEVNMTTAEIDMIINRLSKLGYTIVEECFLCPQTTRQFIISWV